MIKMLRREFIKSLGLSVTGAFLTTLPDKICAKANTPLICSHCGALAKRWNSYAAGNKKGVFCPNCGIEVREGAFMLQTSSTKPVCKAKKKRPVNRKWECAWVPFPNPELVAQTGKPKMKFSQIKF